MKVKKKKKNNLSFEKPTSLNNSSNYNQYVLNKYAKKIKIYLVSYLYFPKTFIILCSECVFLTPYCHEQRVKNYIDLSPLLR